MVGDDVVVIGGMGLGFIIFNKVSVKKSNLLERRDFVVKLNGVVWFARTRIMAKVRLFLN
jgi:hypothetical protein